MFLSARISLLFAALWLPLGGAAAVDQVLVTAPCLSGYWSVTGPNLIQIKLGPFSGIRIIYSGATDVRDICLLRHLGSGLSATCSAGLSSNADGGVVGDRIKLRWWSGPANLIFSGRWDRNGVIAGNFSGGLVGMKVTGGVPASLRKVVLPAAGGNPASLAAARDVLGDLKAGRLTAVRYEPVALKRVWRAEAWPDAKAPASQLTYLGQIHVHWQQRQPDLREDVYEVRSGPDVSLCRIALSRRGLVDDFACQQGAPALSG